MRLKNKFVIVKPKEIILNKKEQLIQLNETKGKKHNNNPNYINEE